MIKISVMYPNTAGSRFDMDYYLNKHIPMVRAKVGAALKGVAVDQGLGSVPPGAPPAYLAVGHLLFDSMEAFGASFGPHAAAVEGDVPNYTNTHAVILISEIKMSV
jgi:uncharacterized protein (TIGR02118 family)